MPTSSISADVTAANGKMAQFLRRREEEEASLGIGKKKVRKEADRQKRQLPKGRQAKWRLEPDFTAPTPMVDRPRTTSGATSFHFSYITISKQGSPTLKGKPISGFGPKSQSPGADHAKYVERDGAAERVVGAEHASYIERPDAVERMQSAGEIAEANERIVADVVNETPFRDEAQLLGLEAFDEGVPSIFSNISDDPFEREEFWRAVHRVEREPKSHSIIPDPQSSPDWWDAMRTHPDMDEDFRNHCLNELALFRAWSEREARSPSGNPYPATPYTKSAEGIGRALEGATKVPGWNHIDPPLEFKSGRGGRVQFRFVAELPHELDAADRALIVQNFCDHLGSFSKDEAGQPTGLMYTAVIHAPDAHNDRRNYHLHVIAHDRPAKWLAEHDQWDFEYAEQFSHKGEFRTRYPHRQNKIGEVSQGESKTGRPGSGIDFIPTLRKKFADINNAVLQARGIERRLDPRRYEEMGIQRTPTEHLGTQAAALESVGVPTVVGDLNAIRIWHDAERAVRSQTRAFEAALRKEQRDLATLTEAGGRALPESQSITTLRNLSAERQMLMRDVAEDRELLVMFDHMEAKAKSRAVRTRQTCLQYLADNAAQKSSPTIRTADRLIRARFEAAQAHIDKIDAALAPDRPALARAAADVMRRERRIQEIDAILAPIKDALRNAIPDRQIKAAERRLDQAGQAARGATEPTPEATVPDRAPTATRDSVPSAPAPTGAVAPAITEAQAPEPSSPIDLAPPSVEGAPIIVPTIDPVPPIARPPAVDLDLAPEGLSPLRPMADEPAVEPAADSIAVSIDDGALAEAPETSPAQQPDEPTPSQQPASTETAPPVAEPVEQERAAPATGGPDAGLTAEEATPSEQAPTPDPAAVAPADEQRTPPAAPPPTPAAAPEASPADQAPAEPATAADPALPDGDQPVPVETPRDGRRRENDPTLFPVEESVAPVKPGTQRDLHLQWDTLIKRISQERIPIVQVEDRGRLRVEVPGLDPEEQALLTHPRFANRSVSRLAAIVVSHEREVERLVRWISTKGRDPAELTLENRVARFGPKVPASVSTLMKNWRSHPRVIEALRAENERRVAIQRELERSNREAEAVVLAPVAPDRAALLAAAARAYPDPSVPITPLVRELTTLLRELAAPERIQEVAERISRDPYAREDVNRYTVDLALAYKTSLDDDALRHQRGRDRRGR